MGFGKQLLEVLWEVVLLLLFEVVYLASRRHVHFDFRGQRVSFVQVYLLNLKSIKLAWGECQPR